MYALSIGGKYFCLLLQGNLFLCISIFLFYHKFIMVSRAFWAVLRSALPSAFFTSDTFSSSTWLAVVVIVPVAGTAAVRFRSSYRTAPLILSIFIPMITLELYSSLIFSMAATILAGVGLWKPPFSPRTNLDLSTPLCRNLQIPLIRSLLFGTATMVWSCHGSAIPLFPKFDLVSCSLIQLPRFG